MPSTFSVIAALALTVGCAVLAKIFLDAMKGEKYAPAVWLKGGAGLCFVLIGLIMLIGSPSPFGWKVMIGLTLGLIGDEVLALRFLHRDKESVYFMAGALTFAVGHVFYIIALIGIGGNMWIPAAVIALIGGTMSLLYNRKKGSDAGELKGAAIGYICLVVVMGSIACACMISGFSAKTALFAIGGVGFVVSDNILVAYSFGKDKRFLLNILVHITYYMAQLCIAWSIGF